MSVDRKRAVFNEHVNEQHERKQLKEEQKRLERMQRLKKRPKANTTAYFDLEAHDFSSLELRVLAWCSK